MAIIPLGGRVVTAICGHAVLTVFIVVYTVCWRAFRQSICDPDLLGRVSGACRAIAFTGAFVGTLLAGLILGLVSDISLVLFACGALTIVNGLIGLRLLYVHGAPTNGSAPGAATAPPQDAPPAA
ncbi:hypothetical protein [Streptomyces zagrosensis]|uniref:Uncharacterized protein n=1 Tax=Streptomyces zagrosensis TaxID=1042984 RepID=A0A7W9QF24_9ACTN|nr:hypothetical protein [Streptomyces zagrosensis]MBB5937837.1 hypothetical protein [Streptomyces zagrosensis]